MILVRGWNTVFCFSTSTMFNRTSVHPCEKSRTGLGEFVFGRPSLPQLTVKQSFVLHIVDGHTHYRSKLLRATNSGLIAMFLRPPIRPKKLESCSAKPVSRGNQAALLKMTVAGMLDSQ